MCMEKHLNFTLNGTKRNENEGKLQDVTKWFALLLGWLPFLQLIEWRKKTNKKHCRMQSCSTFICDIATFEEKISASNRFGCRLSGVYICPYHPFHYTNTEQSTGQFGGKESPNSIHISATLNAVCQMKFVYEWTAVALYMRVPLARCAIEFERETKTKESFANENHHPHYFVVCIWHVCVSFEMRARNTVSIFHFLSHYVLCYVYVPIAHLDFRLFIWLRESDGPVGCT